MAGFVDPVVMPKRDSPSSATVVSGQRRKPSSDWEKDEDPSKLNKKLKRNDTRDSSRSEDGRSSISRSLVHRQTESRRVPYFRYFGPTAIVPGFKQMVVDVQQSKHRDRRKSRGGSFSTTSPSSLTGQNNSVLQHHYTDSGAIIETLEDMPSYDVNDTGPVHPIIITLCQTFFAHLGCDYRFLKPERFFRLLDEKRVEPILVDAMCALAARFSDLPIFTNEHDGKAKRSEYGQVFAQRAKAAMVDTFPCPSVAAVQAFIMMAYEGFGANQDSALWMYLGCAIRMAVDLGLQKAEGVKYQGERDPWYTRSWSHKDRDGSREPEGKQNEETLSLEEQAELEQERVDTFWAVFVLDRIISSGTGRPVNFRDGDFELSFPKLERNPTSGWPDPFPIFLEIIHLYGRASDVLNDLRDANDLTEDKMQKLAQMEHDLTCIHSKQDQRLTFFPEFFRAHVMIGQGTTFILMHFWFHALVIVLHQPTLLTPFYNKRPLRLSPNSHELAISSAKTIADILSFSELLDPKSFTWNPFTSQPIYIAACCFLMDSVANPSQPSSREPSPFPEMKARILKAAPGGITGPIRHSLLASAANQNYQRCYKCLEDLEQYWGGVRYILTALDQKSKGIWDCETFTNEEYDAVRFSCRNSLGATTRREEPVAYSLTGTTNSPNTNLTLLYQLTSQPTRSTALPPPQPPAPPSVPVSAATPPGNMPFDPVRANLPDTSTMFPPPYPQPNISAVRYQPHTPKQLAPLPHSPAQNKPSHLKYESSPSDLDLRSAAMSYTSSSFNDHSTSTTPTDSGIGLQNGQQSNQQNHNHNQNHCHQNNNEHGNENHDNRHVNGNGHHSSHHNNSHHNNHHDFGDQFSQAGSYYLGINPVTETITFDNQEVNFDVLGLQSDMMPPWLEILPDNILGGLVDGGLFGGGGHHGHHGHDGHDEHDEHDGNGNEHGGLGSHGYGNHHHGHHHQHHGSHHGHGQHT